MLSLPQLVSKPPISNTPSHQLNNEGCLCQFCQKLNINENMVQSVFSYSDRESQLYNPYHHKENYLDLLDEIMEWQQKCQRKLRFCLPQICVFFGGSPVHLLTKAKDSNPIKFVRSKSKLNVFELQHFFLDGYLQHQPQTLNKNREKHLFKEKMRQICIIAAKYEKNVTALLTLDQLGNMFKTKFKYMKDNLMYLQTLVGGHHSAEHLLKIDIDQLRFEQEELFQRAKLEASIFANIIKITDSEYYHEKQEIQFEHKLRGQNRKLYLTYLSLKIILISSRFKDQIIKQCTFKWTCVKNNDYLWDLRVVSYDKSSNYWKSSHMKALEFKLEKTMSMLELEPKENQLVNQKRLSPKTKEFEKWLQKSTENEWNEMKVIRNRLQKLESQKKALLASQSQGHSINKLFRKRDTMKKKDSFMSQSFNPEHM